jgi:hypothetical protein
VTGENMTKTAVSEASSTVVDDRFIEELVAQDQSRGL